MARSSIPVPQAAPGPCWRHGGGQQSARHQAEDPKGHAAAPAVALRVPQDLCSAFKVGEQPSSSMKSAYSPEQLLGVYLLTES